MKSIYMFFLLILIAISCGKEPSGEKDESNIDSTVSNLSIEDLSQHSANPPQDNEPGEIDSGKIKLVYKFLPDLKREYKLINITSTRQSFEADSIIESKLNQNLEYHIETKVVNRLDNGSANITIKISSLKMDAVSDDRKITYNSDLQYGTEERKQFGDYEALVNNPFNILINSNGEVKEVTKGENIVNKLLEIQNASDSLTAAEKVELTANLSESVLKPLVQKIYRILSINKVGVNSTWEFSYPSNLAVFQLQNTAKFRLLEFIGNKEEGTVKVSAALDVKVTGNNFMTQNGINYTFSNPELSGSGTLFFDNGKGCISKSETTTKMEMAVVMEAVEPGAPARKATRKDFSVTTSYVELL